MLRNKYLFILFCSCLFAGTASSQVKITNGANRTVTDGAMLDLESTNRGLLLPRIALTDAKLWTLAGIATDGMMIYNTSTSTANSLSGAGIYVWSSVYTMWSKMLTTDNLATTDLVYVGLRRTSTQNFGNTESPAIWDTSVEFSNNTTMYQPATSTSKIFIPVDGVYLVSSSMRITASNSPAGSLTNDRSYYIRVNGSATYTKNATTGNTLSGTFGAVGASYSTTSAGVDLGRINLNIHTIIDLHAGDYIEACVNNNTGAAVVSDHSLGTLRMQVYQLPSSVNP